MYGELLNQLNTSKTFTMSRTLRQCTINILIVLVLVVPSTISDKYQQVYNRSIFDSSDASVPLSRSGCGSCNMREEIKNRSLEIIRSEVLEKLGLKMAPNITGKALSRVPQHYLDMINDLDNGMLSDEPHQFNPGVSITEEEDEFHLKTQKVLIFAHPYPRLRHSWRGHDILHFTFSDSITKFHVSNATLYLYIKGTERHPVPEVVVEIFKVYKLPDHPDAPGLYRVFARKIKQPLGRGDFLQVDFSETISEWFKNPRDNYGFVVNATVNGRKVVVTDTGVDNGNKAPFVDISTVESRHRTRRSMYFNCDDKVNEHLCCRYPLEVDFEKFGWDFIIAPKKYQAHYCSGECPFITLQKHPHTHLKQMASPNSAQPCCAPRKFSAINMLYFDENSNVIYGHLPGMVVDRCGCA